MFRLIRGMKDLYGVDFNKYDFIVSQAKKIGLKYGFETIKTPMLEYTDVFQRSIGNETDVVSKEMYSFLDKGGESITLRPEGTAGVMRSIVSESMFQHLPVKLMYYGEMFRYDRPQKGRYRQFHQIGFEQVGDKSPYTDVSLIMMASKILNSIGIFDFNIQINTLGDDKTREDYTRGLVKYLSRHEESLSEDSKIRLQKNPLRILDSKDASDKEICSMAPIITDYLSNEAGDYFEKVCDLLSASGLNYEINNFLVRGLDYYAHTAFEFKSTKSDYKDALGGGGRYDKLVQLLGGPDISGIGFAFGVERLMMMLDSEKFKPAPNKIAVVPVTENENDTAFELYKLLLNCDLPAEFLHLGNISKKMKVANRLSCEVAIIIGETEHNEDTLTVKFMNRQDNASQVINRNDVVNFLKYSLV